MRERALLDLVDVFFHPSFGRETVERVVGPARRAAQPNRWVVEARDPTLAGCVVETVPPELAGTDGPFVSGLQFYLRQPTGMDLGRLARTFGPWIEPPLMEPDDDHRYSFAVQRWPYEGYFELASSRPAQAGRCRVRAIIVRRLPPLAGPSPPPRP